MNEQDRGVTNAELALELQQVKSELTQLRQLLTATGPLESATQSTRQSLRVHFSGLPLERKPFAIQFEGALSQQFSLSTIRTAILLTLLFDLQDRGDGGRGVVDPPSTIARINALLRDEEEPGDVPNSVRVAIYRFDIFSKEKSLFNGSEFSINYDPENCRLEAFDEGGSISPHNLDLHITTSHDALSRILDDVLGASPLQRLRKEKAMYLPGGADGIDRFVLEVFDHQFPVQQTSLFYRPSFQSFPESLLEHIGVSEQKMRRRAVLLQGYQTGRCRYHEIINRSALWNLIRFGDGGTFALYPSQIEAAEIVNHLEYMASLLDDYEHYRLVITDAFFPFYLATYEIESGPLAEYYTLFLRRLEKQKTYDEGSFVIEGQKIYQGIVEKILRAVFSDPTTATKRANVQQELREIAQHLTCHGPLKPSEAIPIKDEAAATLVD